jgi:HAD superfamily hydrolase (TIGR01509 family)
LVKAVIFDIDGTLMDSNDAHAETWVCAFAKHGKKLAFEEAQKLIGMGADLILEKYLSKEEIGDFGDDLKDYRSALFLEEYLPEIKLFPRMRELLERIKAEGKRIALASSANEKELEKYKKIMKIDDLLDEETSDDDAENSKPAPDIFQAAVKKLGGIQAGDCVVVGDTPYDAEAATKANLKIIGVESGGWSRQKLFESGCSEVYQDVAGLLENYEDSLLNQ